MATRIACDLPVDSSFYSILETTLSSLIHHVNIQALRIASLFAHGTCDQYLSPLLRYLGIFKMWFCCEVGGLLYLQVMASRTADARLGMHYFGIEPLSCRRLFTLFLSLYPFVMTIFYSF
ncbi:hypothetical protein CPB83DRAFT_585397 [Crepidotus variabilis]|uniref:Uncharacterized protein n=1 Tax=Crepidotus variabilis TaxID=179855 RepID=A0A9P6JUV2_9AGAR|nr:hypothetical protein CPB83DRAFT_585397 [Crepidotus variabilis]